MQDTSTLRSTGSSIQQTRPFRWHITDSEGRFKGNYSLPEHEAEIISALYHLKIIFKGRRIEYACVNPADEWHVAALIAALRSPKRPQNEAA